MTLALFTALRARDLVSLNNDPTRTPKYEGDSFAVTRYRRPGWVIPVESSGVMVGHECVFSKTERGIRHTDCGSVESIFQYTWVAVNQMESVLHLCWPIPIKRKESP